MERQEEGGNRGVNCADGLIYLFLYLQAGCFNSIPGEGWCDLRQTHLGLGQCGGCGYWIAGTHIYKHLFILNTDICLDTVEKSLQYI